MISLKDTSEISKTPIGPITERKDYLSEDEAEKRGSFRKYILQTPEYQKSKNISKHESDKEESSVEDISLMQGLPASMK